MNKPARIFLHKEYSKSSDIRTVLENKLVYDNTYGLAGGLLNKDGGLQKKNIL
jgi:hypothetical protein